MSLIYRYIAFFLLVFTPPAVFAQKSNDTLNIFFDLDNPALTQKATTSIDQWLYNDRITPQQNILIVGYADYLGTDKYNDNLSRNRASNTQDYLVKMGIDTSHIKLLVGRGEVKRNIEQTDGYPTDRRVDIVLLSDSIPPHPTPPPPAKKTVSPKPAAPLTSTELKLTTLKPGETFPLENIYFYTNRHVVVKESIPELDKLYQALANNPTVRIQVEGHVCCVKKDQDALDEDTLEQALSVNRAKHICEYLVRRGITPDRLEYRGFGKSRPLVENEVTEEDAAKNRRVEIRLLSN
ncbi:OmpA family protein [Polluticoccus soli]|uniref:OmpA family protein n=1 Tax=Polluticoccus soli TaxID=3034150 RepID=UPI0023E2C5C9|nr:OmpA family protein [Flavipsychrobacter sp. JY13-12]